jgi:hypothetical protein
MADKYSEVKYSRRNTLNKTNSSIVCLIMTSLLKYMDVERYIILKQNGLCRHCKMKFDRSDMIISSGRANKKYYHKKCADKLNII